VAAGFELNPRLLTQVDACDAMVAKVEALDYSTAADSIARHLTALLCSTPGARSAAQYVMDLPGDCGGKFRAICIDPDDPDSSTVVTSNEVSFNTGAMDDFAPIVLRASHTHGSARIEVHVVGAGLSLAAHPVLVARDGSSRTSLSVVAQNDNGLTAEGTLPEALGESDLQLDAGGRPVPAARIAGDLVLGVQPASVSSVYYIDPDPNVYPKDFAFNFTTVPTSTPNVWRGLFHLTYTRHSKTALPDANEVTLGHAWTSRPDLPGSWGTDLNAFAVGASGSWDQKHVYAPSVIPHDGKYHMFYTGVDASGNESIGYTTTALLDTTNTSWGPRTQVLSTAPVFKPDWVAPPGGGFNAALRDPFVMEDLEHPGRLLMYYVAGNRNEQTQQAPNAFFRNAVGVVRSQADINLPWQDLGYFRSTDNRHSGTSNAESPHVVPDAAHASPEDWSQAVWRLMFTDGPAAADRSILFTSKSFGESLADTSLGHWTTPATRLYPYLLNDPTVFGWEATEYLRVGNVDFLAAYDGVGIAITRMYWSGPDFIVGFPSVTEVGKTDRPGASLRFSLSDLVPGSQRVGFWIELASPARVSLAVFDLAGRRIRRLVDRDLPAGQTPVSWDCRDDQGSALKSGMYFARLTCPAGQRVVRVPFVR
jgi:hypothetical protein